MTAPSVVAQPNLELMSTLATEALTRLPFSRTPYRVEVLEAGILAPVQGKHQLARTQVKCQVGEQEMTFYLVAFRPGDGTGDHTSQPAEGLPEAFCPRPKTGIIAEAMFPLGTAHGDYWFDRAVSLYENTLSSHGQLLTRTIGAERADVMRILNEQKGNLDMHPSCLTLDPFTGYGNPHAVAYQYDLSERGKPTVQVAAFVPFTDREAARAFDRPARRTVGTAEALVHRHTDLFG